MANETWSPLPSHEVQWPFVALTYEPIQPVPEASEGGDSNRPTVGQAWPRGNTRGNG
jgi:hypothetical protein